VEVKRIEFVRAVLENYLNSENNLRDKARQVCPVGAAGGGGGGGGVCVCACVCVGGVRGLARSLACVVGD
jgi:hypothetical protein